MKQNFPVEQFKNLPTPFYYYDMDLLAQTLTSLKEAIADSPNFHVHYAVKANANTKILSFMAQHGFGCDCVSGGEVKAALEAGCPSDRVVFAGVGKADWEIELALQGDIHCFNVESQPELEIIDEIAGRMGKVARVALRVNPNVDAKTHHYITTGLNENKFGISLAQLDEVIMLAQSLEHVKMVGIHFHIGSQLLDMEPFVNLCTRINDLQDEYEAKGITFESINVGGGLGVDYKAPQEHPIPNFADYFQVFKSHLKLRPNQELHFELGRSMICQVGSLISKTLYVKKGVGKQFIILDAGMSDLIRPALYQAHHVIENLSSTSEVMETYDVVGPICESSDCFGKDELIQTTQRGDYFALRSAGAYGQIMACQYNCRALPQAVYSDEI